MGVWHQKHPQMRINPLDGHRLQLEPLPLRAYLWVFCAFNRLVE